LLNRACALDACQLMMARKFGVVETLPSMSEDDISDQSKGDFVVKLAAFYQVVYLVLQLIV